MKSPAQTNSAQGCFCEEKYDRKEKENYYADDYRILQSVMYILLRAKQILKGNAL